MSGEDLLVVEGLRAGYGRAEVLHDVSIRVGQGETIAIIGSNGAGKSTLMRSIIGLVRPMSGSIRLDGAEVSGARPERLVTRGVALVPEGRLLFSEMSVRENLEAGAYRVRGRGRGATIRERMRRVHELFPVLSERSSQPAATLSGGEQQMLAVARALMSNPRLLLLDEPSLGLAPKVIAEIFSAMDKLRSEGGRDRAGRAGQPAGAQARRSRVCDARRARGSGRGVARFARRRIDTRNLLGFVERGEGLSR
ncbi:MAG: ABC transporter ATP-binding protein [Coriobacteriia bacterium]